MSAPTDRLNDPNSVSFYAPKGPRAVRLSEVSEAAAALVPADFGGEVRNGPRGELLDPDAAIQQLRARRALAPDLPPVPPMPIHTRSWSVAALRLTSVVAAAAVIAFIAVEYVPLPDPLREPAADRELQLVAASPRPTASLAVQRPLPIQARLTVQDTRASKDEPAPLGVTLQGRADAAVVVIVGLPAGMTVSTGDALGADAWQVPAADLADARIVPPKNFVGPADVIVELRLADNAVVDRRSLHLEWTDVAGAAAPAAPAVAAPLRRPLDRDEIAALLRRGKELVASGDLAAARLVLRPAAEAQDAEAALALAATYDPLVLRELKVFGVTADAAMARDWYEKAKELGSAEAPRRLEKLASAPR